MYHQYKVKVNQKGKYWAACGAVRAHPVFRFRGLAGAAAIAPLQSGAAIVHDEPMAIRRDRISANRRSTAALLRKEKA
jgi:precorrin isomerase